MLSKVYVCPCHTIGGYWLFLPNHGDDQITIMKAYEVAKSIHFREIRPGGSPSPWQVSQLGLGLGGLEAWYGKPSPTSPSMVTQSEKRVWQVYENSTSCHDWNICMVHIGTVSGGPMRREPEVDFNQGFWLPSTDDMPWFWFFFQRSVSDSWGLPKSTEFCRTAGDSRWPFHLERSLVATLVMVTSSPPNKERCWNLLQLCTRCGMWTSWVFRWGNRLIQNGWFIRDIPIRMV